MIEERMKSVTRPVVCLLVFFSASECVPVLFPAHAQERGIAGEVGKLTLTFRYKGEAVSRGEFKDRTTYDQTATIVCPVTAGDIASTSSILGPTEEQERANAQLGAAAKKQIDGISPKAISEMKSLDKQMKECKASGKSAQVCGMQVMMAMQSNPNLMAEMGAMGSRGKDAREAADKAVADAADSYQPWYNEGCTGTMTVNNTSQLDDPTIAGPEPIIRTTGTDKINTRDTLVTVETDLKRKQTRYMIIAPEGSFHRDASYGEKPTRQTLMAIPANPVVAGPYPGPIQSGSYEKKLSGGSYSVEWSFVRG